ncbi:MAG TPA: GNAT family N-acetyltransferase [Rhodothermales bacterium]|nr:GNAT family N-acetyltransferase [Rhodothermales bacterium]
MPVSIRSATPVDAKTIVSLILELADYEKLRHEAVPDADALRTHLSSDGYPHVEALVAEDEETGPVGFALYFHNYSTFLTRFGIYLEDLYVRPDFRGQGIGFALLKRVAEVAVERGCGRMEWAVLDWNAPAVKFYRRLGAKPMDDWTVMRLTGDALRTLGEADGF